MKKTKKIWIGILVLVSLLIILPFLIPVRTYLNEAEQMAGNKLGVPVTITSGQLMLLPTPRVLVSGVIIGKQQEIKVEQMSVVPALSSIFFETKVIDLKVKRPVIKKSALDIVAAFSARKSEPDSESGVVNIQHITVEELQLDWPDMKLPMLNLELDLTSANKLASARIETPDGNMQANVMPEGDEHSIIVNAEKWISPIGLPVLIDKAKLEMRLKAEQLQVSNIDITMYGGKVTGNSNLFWGKNWRMNGKFKVSDLSVKEPSRMVSKKVYLSGGLSGSGSFSATAKDAAALADNLHADFRFNVNNGVLHGLDLVKLASLLTRQTESGGETQFDEFSGVLNVRGKQYGLHDIKISSGLLAATGQVKVKPNKELDGVVEVALKKGVSLAAIPLQVSGTVDKPVVLPTKAALAGAVAGTAILGPGLGTSLGIKAGGAVDKFKGLFQSK